MESAVGQTPLMPRKMCLCQIHRFFAVFKSTYGYGSSGFGDTADAAYRVLFMFFSEYLREYQNLNKTALDLKSGSRWSKLVKKTENKYLALLSL
jgi:hypothetical protein